MTGDQPGHEGSVAEAVEVAQRRILRVEREVGAVHDRARSAERRNRSDAGVDHGDIDARAGVAGIPPGRGPGLRVDVGHRVAVRGRVVATRGAGHDRRRAEHDRRRDCGEGDPEPPAEPAARPMLLDPVYSAHPQCRSPDTCRVSPAFVASRLTVRRRSPEPPTPSGVDGAIHSSELSREILENRALRQRGGVPRAREAGRPTSTRR